MDTLSYKIFIILIVGVILNICQEKMLKRQRRIRWRIPWLCPGWCHLTASRVTMADTLNSDLSFSAITGCGFYH
ncbi:hypothetical protein AB205_0049040 [Aquarana catesbeiana]|uniref:Uncharacterized protein n=1 Tax=Aquarana catesbeiana TaxID=8400 RepID=A0A2G9QD76_AQUCT|nr:hypothetical protein AB205_0049040 [Aquarana catesbeiana]